MYLKGISQNVKISHIHNQVLCSWKLLQTEGEYISFIWFFIECIGIFDISFSIYFRKMRIQIVLLAFACVTGIIADVAPPKDDFLGELTDAALAEIRSHPNTIEGEEEADDFGAAAMEQDDAMANEERAIKDAVELARDEEEEEADELELDNDRAEDDVLAIKEFIDEYYKDTLKDKDSSQ